MLMLSLDDAVKVAKRLIADNMDDDEIIRQEMEQKCWFPPTEDEAAKRLNDLIFDITPAEICSEIESDNLRNWCNIVQTEMKMAMVQLPSWANEDMRTKETDCDYERAVDQLEHDMLYEPTFNQDDGSM